MLFFHHKFYLYYILSKEQRHTCIGMRIKIIYTQNGINKQNSKKKVLKIK